MCVCVCVCACSPSPLLYFPGCVWGEEKQRIHHIHTPTGPAGSVCGSSAPAQSGPANAPAFPRPASRGRCEAMDSSSP